MGEREHPGPFRVVAGAMLNPHRQSVLANGCVKPSVDPITRTPGTIYEPKGQVRLLGLLSESSPSRQEEYLDAGGGMLICMKRTRKKGPNPARKGCSLEAQNSAPSLADDTEAGSNPDPNRGLVSPTPEANDISPSPSLVPESTTPPRPGSFPFHWMWESFSVKGQGVYQDQAPEKTKKKRSPRTSALSVREPPSTPEPAVTGGKDSHSSLASGPSAGAEGSRSRPPKHRQHGGLPPGNALLPLYWKVEARSEARKRQLRQERRRWLHLAQQLLSLEDQAPKKGRPLSVKQLEEKLRAELLCLATEPEEPGPPRDVGKTRTRARAMEDEPTFKPTINHKIPNFKNLQKRFQEQLMQRKDQAKLTICKPFRLHSASSSRTFSTEDNSQDGEDPFHEVRRLWRSHWRALSCPEFGPPLSCPVMHTKTSDKRREANRLLLSEWERRERQEKRRAELRRAKEQQVQRDVARCLATYRPPGCSSASLQRRREDLRRQEKQRMEEYTLQLQAMRERVESRPYLFERVMQANARQAVERRFSQVLATLGIEEEMLWKQAGRPSSGVGSAKATHRKREVLEDLAEST
uniref:Testis-specific protein 10-interacting protein n=1 Tax=Pogona vitticeps TaxID=103695 RepID=A0A6J0VED8_9SAUR